MINKSNLNALPRSYELIIIVAVLSLEDIHNNYYPSRAVIKQHWWQLIFGWVAAFLWHFITSDKQTIAIYVINT
jgi:hypothetical protein